MEASRIRRGWREGGSVFDSFEETWEGRGGDLGGGEEGGVMDVDVNVDVWVGGGNCFVNCLYVDFEGSTIIGSKKLVNTIVIINKQASQ